MKSKRNLIILTLVIAISLIGVTYAFFDYYMLGANQKITAGKVNLILNEGEDTINRSNIFPETKEKARSRTDNFITFTVSGVNTTEDQDIYYEIMLNEGDPETGMTRFDARDLVFDLVELDAEGNETTYLVDALSYKDINARRIWVNTVDRNNATEVNKTYKLRMWLSEDVKISDTNPSADYPSTGYENYYASVKLSVYGDFVEKQQPYNYMANLGTPEIVTETATVEATFWPESIENVKANITEVNFVSMQQNLIDSRYEVATIKEDVSDTEKSGSVKVWLENGELVTAEDGTETQYYTMYVASEGITYFPENCNRMFSQFSSLINVNFENVDTRNAVIFSRMFLQCTNLINVDFASFDTSQVTTMEYMFYQCSSLASLDLSRFNTSKVTTMQSMFYSCSSLTSLDLSSFDTSQVTTMVYMFSQCSSLASLDLSSFDTSSVTTMENMFSQSSSLTSLDLSHFDTSNVTIIGTMFYECKKLSELNLDNFNTEKVTTMANMFYNCNSLTSLDLSSFDTSNVLRMTSMFQGCSELIDLDLSNFDTSNVTYMQKMFYGCSSLTSLDLSNFNLNSATTTQDMFYLCSNLITIYSNSDWSANNVTSFANMFGYCNNLVGAVPFDRTKIDIKMANPTTGYFTKKEA